MARQCGEALLHLSMLAQRARGARANGPVMGSGWLVRAHFAVKSVRSMHGGPAMHSMPVGSASSARARGAARSEGAAERARSGATTTELLKSMGGSVREMMRRSSQPNLYGCGPRGAARPVCRAGSGCAASRPDAVRPSTCRRRCARARGCRRPQRLGELQ